jgi:hypothetical protein
MKIFATALLLAALTTAAAETTEKTVTGWVSDAHCGVAHVGGKNPSCVAKCVKGGAHIGHPEWKAQDMILVVDGSQELVVIANPDALTGHEAKHVTVAGTMKEDRLHVTSVKAAE